MATSAFAAGPTQDGTDDDDPFVPVAATGSMGAGATTALIIGGSLLAIAAIASSSGTD
jgi:hypothetical protein